MNRTKRLLCGFIAICLMITTFAVTPQVAQAATTSGNDGEIHWEIKGDTLTLSAVKGTKGRMNDYSYYGECPWGQKSPVKTIVINDGITELGEYTFLDSSVNTVVLPNSVKDISAQLFNSILGGTNVKTVYGYKGSTAEQFVKKYNERVQDCKQVMDSSGSQRDLLYNQYNKKWNVDADNDPDNFLLFFYYTSSYDCSWDKKDAIKFTALDNSSVLSKAKVTTSVSLKKGKSQAIKVTLPANLNKVTKYSGNPCDVKVTYKSSNKKIATVSSSGKVTAKKKGTAKVTVTMQIKNGAKKTFTTKITVK